MAPPSLDMSSFLSKFRRSPSKQPASSPSPRAFPNVVPNDPCQSLDYWKIKSHDRDDLIERIMPYMAASFRREQLLESIIEQKPWVAELIRSELAEEDAVENDPKQFRKTTTAFWKAPEAMVDDLLDVARCYFRILLRYTYRTRYWSGRERALRALDLRDLSDNDFVSQLNDEEIYNLTCRPNRYGATYYRDSYKYTRQRLGWIRFCSRVENFCQSVGLNISLNKMEDALEDLRQDLPRIVSNRKLENVARHSHKNLHMVRKTDKDVKKLREQVTSSAAHSARVIVGLQEEMGEMSRRLDEVAAINNNRDVKRLRQDIKSLRNDVKRLDEQTASGVAHNDTLAVEVQQEVQDLRSRMEHLEPSGTTVNLKREIEFARRQLDELTVTSASQSLESQAPIETLRRSSHEIMQEMKRVVPEDKEDYERRIQLLQDELELHRLKDSLDSCRELMEKLLPDWPADKTKVKGNWRPRGQEYGKRWRELFFSKEWDRCKKKRPEGHPLLGLVDDQKYFAVGENLYGTLSERFHNHQEHRDKELDKDVLTLVFSILPPDWEETRRWDLETEKERWGLP